MRDTLMEYARTAVIPLHHGVGRYVRIQLEFDAKWMLISEVQFDSGRWRPDMELGHWVTGSMYACILEQLSKGRQCGYYLVNGLKNDVFVVMFADSARIVCSRSLGHRVNGSFGSSFTSGSPGHHFDPM